MGSWSFLSVKNELNSSARNLRLASISTELLQGRELRREVRYLLATSTQVRLLLEKSMLHNRKYFVLCMP